MQAYNVWAVAVKIFMSPPTPAYSACWAVAESPGEAGGRAGFDIMREASESSTFILVTSLIRDEHVELDISHSVMSFLNVLGTSG